MTVVVDPSSELTHIMGPALTGSGCDSIQGGSSANWCGISNSSSSNVKPADGDAGGVLHSNMGSSSPPGTE